MKPLVFFVILLVSSSVSMCSVLCPLHCNVSNSRLVPECVAEVVRWNGAELHNVAAFMGGVAAQVRGWPCASVCVCVCVYACAFVPAFKSML